MTRMTRTPVLTTLIGTALTLALAVYGCGSDKKSTTSDGGDNDASANGQSSGGSGGSTTGTGGSTAGTGGAAGSGSAGSGGSAGTGGAAGTGGRGGSAGTGGAAGAGGQGGQGMIRDAGVRPDTTPPAMCQAGMACTADCSTTCGGQGNNQGTRTCKCVGAILLCGACVTPDGGAANPNAGMCPANADGMTCTPGTFCQGAGGAAGCVCLQNQWRCSGGQGDAAPAAACDAPNPAGTTCMTMGNVCESAPDGGRARRCLCLGNAANLRWACF